MDSHGVLLRVSRAKSVTMLKSKRLRNVLAAGLVLLTGAAGFAFSKYAPSNMTVELKVSAEDFNGNYVIDVVFNTDGADGSRHGGRYSLIAYAGVTKTQIHQVPLPYGRLRSLRIAPLSVPGVSHVTIESIRFHSWFSSEALTGLRLKSAVRAFNPSITIDEGADVLTASSDGTGYRSGNYPSLQIDDPPSVNTVPVRYRLVLAVALAGIAWLVVAVFLAPHESASAPVEAADAIPVTSSTSGLLFSSAISIAIYLWCFGAEELNPTNIRWLMDSGGDHAAHYLAWTFFRNSPWTFPPGLIPTYYAPLGTSIASTDALPLFAFIFKTFSAFLPEPFQYYGLWVLFCYVLQGYFGLLLMQRVTPRRPLQLAGATLFVCSPVLLARSNHLALMGHWTILASLYLYFVNDTVMRRARWCVIWSSLALVSSLIQPYLTAMVLAIFLAWLLRLTWAEGKMSSTLAWVSVGVVTSAALVGMFVGGNFQVIDPLDYWWWYKLYSTNLNAIVNSQGKTFFQSALPTRVQYYPQREGFQYLGFGMILLGCYAILLVLTDIKMCARWKRHWPLVLILSAVALFSLSNEITLGEYTLLQYSIPAPAKVLTNAFRSSARLFWPVYYTIFYAVLVITVGRGRARLAVPLMAVVCILQLIDISPLRPVSALYAMSNDQEQYPNRLQSPLWQQVFSSADTIVMYPPYSRIYNEPEDYKDFVYLAALHNKAITTGYVSRTDMNLVWQVTARLEEKLRSDGCEEHAMYILSARYYERNFLDRGPFPDCRRGIIDGYYVVLAKNNQLALPAGNVIE